MGRRSRRRRVPPRGSSPARPRPVAQIQRAGSNRAGSAGLEVGRPVLALGRDEHEEARAGEGSREVQDVLGRLVGQGQRGMRWVSAIQIGKLVMTGPPSRRAGRRSPPSGRPAPVGRCVPREPPPKVGSSATEKRTPSQDPEQPSRARRPGWSSPCARPSRAMPASRASSALNHEQDVDRRRPRAGRCPTVVATGNSEARDQERDEADQRSGRRARPRACHGSATSPINEIGMPSRTRTLNRLCAEPSTRSSMQARRPDREVAGQGRRVVPGEDVEAGQVQRVGDGLAGQRAAERRPGFGIAHGAKTTSRDDRDHADQAQAVAGGPCDREPGHAAQMSASQTASLRVSAPSPSSDAEREQPRVASARRRAGRGRCASSAGSAPSTIAANGIVESGRAEWRSSGR